MTDDRARARLRILLALGLPTLGFSCSSARSPEALPAKADPEVSASSQPTASAPPSAPATATAIASAEPSATAPEPVMIPSPMYGGGCGYSFECVPEAKKAPPKSPAAAPFAACAATKTMPPKSTLADGAFDPEHTQMVRGSDTKKSDLCCYKHKQLVCSGGRLLRAENQSAPLVAAVVRSTDWLDRTLAGLSLPVDSGESAYWLRAAAFEHASVASFARVALELMTFGAPARLVEGTHAAAIDEIAHANICFALARAYGGEALGPGPLPTANMAPLATTLDAFAVATFLDACVSETVASLELRDRARETGDERVRAAILGIAEDEERHAELAFRTVAWAIDKGARGAIESAVDALDLHALSEDSRVVVREVVIPCTRALLDRASSP